MNSFLQGIVMFKELLVIDSIVRKNAFFVQRFTATMVFGRVIIDVVRNVVIIFVELGKAGSQGAFPIISINLRYVWLPNMWELNLVKL